MRLHQIKCHDRFSPAYEIVYDADPGGNRETLQILNLVCHDRQSLVKPSPF